MVTLENLITSFGLPSKQFRNLLLDKHQFFPYFYNLIRKEEGGQRPKVKIVYKRSIRNRIHRLTYKQKKHFGGFITDMFRNAYKGKKVR